MRTTSLLFALPVAALLALTACELDTADSADDATEETTTARDDGAWAACTQFRKTAQDQVDGLLTEDELREQLQQVDDYASIADEQAVATAASDLVSALTTHGYTSQETADGVLAMGQACTDAGY